MATRARPTASAKVDRVLELRTTRWQRRAFLLGVLFAFVGVAEELLRQAGRDAVDDVLHRYPPMLQDASGRNLNTLTISGLNSEIGLRGYYNAAERVARHLLRRDYPNCAPHATGEWRGHTEEFELICSMSPGERAILADALWKELVERPHIPAVDGQDRRERPFEKVLADFPNTERGEPAGSVLQGLAFAYYRADSPNVTLQTGRVGRGSSRTGAVGDIDGWAGRELALTVEVKDKDISVENLAELDQFVRNLTKWPDATAIVLARSFSDDAVDELAQHNIVCINRLRMAENVALWDVPKHLLAVREVLHYFAVIQQHPALTQRFVEFCTGAEIPVDG